jgi:5-methylcytosine-specific restriction endonuclease McrA
VVKDMPKKLTHEEFCERVKEYTNDSVDVVSPYINKRTPVDIKCKVCNHIWQISPATLTPNNMKTYKFNGCLECKYEEAECEYCHKVFKRLKTKLNKKNKTGFVYCSKECGNRHKNEQHSVLNNGLSYRRNAFLAYPHKCAVCGYDEDERVLEVHHIDENRQNNNIDNLIILCPICHKKLTLHICSLQDLFDTSD